MNILTKKPKNQETKEPVFPLFRSLVLALGFGLFACLWLPACGKPPQPPVKEEVNPLTIGAHYFLPGWNQDSLRHKLILPQEPLVVPYDCRQETTIKQHLDWAKQTGIDFFIMQWWGQGTASDVTLKDHIGPYLVTAKSPTKFCLTYLTPYLLKTVNYETTLNPANDAKLIADLSYLARTYFTHPNYYRINDRPVVFLYLSRLLKGDYAKTFNRLRTIIKQQTREEIYLVGDEVFWTEPNQARIGALDAVTTYTMYGPDKYAGYAGETGFLKDMEGPFAKYQKVAAELKKGFIPGVIPGFNDRGIPEKGRLAFQEKHYLIPRILSLSENQEGSFYRAYLKLARRYADSALNLVVVNSWNDWGNDTQIEPVKSAMTATKQPETLTGGYEYSTYGDIYLKITQEEKTPKPAGQK